MAWKLLLVYSVTAPSRVFAHIECHAKKKESFMSLHHFSSGEIIDLRPLGEKLKDTPSAALLKTDRLEVMRLVIKAGKSLPEHHVTGEVTIYCLEGKVELAAHQKKQLMQPGDWVYLDPMQPYALVAQEDASVLVTILLHHGSASPQDPH
jgi:quercetin dioxygenase-like cupin family protein